MADAIKIMNQAAYAKMTLAWMMKSPLQFLDSFTSAQPIQSATEASEFRPAALVRALHFARPRLKSLAVPRDFMLCHTPLFTLAHLR